VRRGVALARRRPPLTSQPGTDEMVLRKKAFEIFMGCANVIHALSPLMKTPSRLERLQRLEPFEPFKKFKPFKSFKSSSEHTVLEQTSRLGESI
jgi:hypothetical protein